MDLIRQIPLNVHFELVLLNLLISKIAHSHQQQSNCKQSVFYLLRRKCSIPNRRLVVLRRANDVLNRLARLHLLAALLSSQGDFDVRHPRE